MRKGQSRKVVICFMPQSLDSFMPSTSFALPGGSVFRVGTMWDDETVRQLVLCQYTPAGAAEPLVEFAVSAASADMIITALQERANEARYISGQPMVDYPALKAAATRQRSTPPRRRPKPPKSPPPA
jgi:hypothetical protein